MKRYKDVPDWLVITILGFDTITNFNQLQKTYNFFNCGYRNKRLDEEFWKKCKQYVSYIKEKEKCDNTEAKIILIKKLKGVI